jgi:hypothetical protein
MASGYKQVIVGEFFERAAHAIFGGELCRNGDGDICLHRQSTTIEVKGSSEQSSYGFRLDLEQVERYESMVPFPFLRAYYVLMAYNNPQSRRSRTSQMAPHVTPKAVCAYLRWSVSWCVVVDLSIVTKWKEVLPRSRTSILGHLGTETVDIRCRDMAGYINGGLAGKLAPLGLPASEYGIASGRVKLGVEMGHEQPYQLNFPMYAILPRGELRNFRRRLNRRGFCLQLHKPA